MRFSVILSRFIPVLCGSQSHLESDVRKRCVRKGVFTRFQYTLLLLAFPAFFCNAQQYNFISYSIECGLPQSTVTDIFKDSRGYIWVTTLGGGVALFDGVKFKAFNNRNGLAGNTVRSVVEDGSGLLWFGTDKGISVFDGKSFKTVAAHQKNPNSTVFKLFRDSRNNIWASYPGWGLLRFKNENDTLPKIYSTENGLNNNFIFDIYEQKPGQLILATYGGGICFLNTENGSMRSLTVSSGLPSSTILCIEKDQDGNFWFGSNDSKPFHIAEKYLEQTSLSKSEVVVLEEFPDKTVWDIGKSSSGGLYFGTDKAGLIGYEYGNLTAYNTSDGLPNNRITKVFVDSSDILWAGTAGNGLSKFSGKRFTHVTTRDGLLNNQVYNIAEDKKGNYFLATYGGGLSEVSVTGSRYEVKNFTTKDGLPENSLTSLCFDADGILWIGTQSSGLVSYDGKTFKLMNSDKGLSDNRVTAILSDNKNRLWVGTSGGITQIDKGKLSYASESNGLVNNEVQSMLQDKQGNIWIATMGGLSKVDETSITNFTEKNGLAEKRINCIALDKQGNLVLGSMGGGVYRHAFTATKKDTFQVLVPDTLLSSPNVSAVCFIDDETLLIATDKGLDKVQIRDNAVLKFASFNSSDGYTGVENNLNAVLKDSRGLVWFGTINGATICDFRNDMENAIPPQTNVTEIKLFFQPVNWKQRNAGDLNWFSMPSVFTMSSGENHLTFGYAALNYSNPTKVRYRFMLEGADKDWSPPVSATEALYSTLDPGSYTFKVVACNENGDWSKVPATISFTIRPPFYRTVWFISLLCGAGLLCGYGYIKWRENELEKKNKVLESTVAERTEEILEQKKLIEEKNKDITDSITYALRIQNAILPPEEKIKHYLPESFVFYHPKDIISGDFYYFASLNSSGAIIEGLTEEPALLVIAVIDCTGHGVPGALMSMIGYNGLNYALVKSQNTGEILDELSGFVERALAINAVETINDGMDISLCSIDIRNKQLSYSGANNPLYLIRKEGQEALPEFLQPEFSKNGVLFHQVKGDKQPVGAFAYRKKFKTTTLQLCAGDEVYLFSDGYADQFGGPDISKFKYSQLKEILVRLAGASSAEKKETVEKAFVDWKGDHFQIDDVCLLGFNPLPEEKQKNERN
jgi:ligand-binding sensor domain-containing protein/serine phosphatase RsbU (regulator of sigma subunit)